MYSQGIVSLFTPSTKLKPETVAISILETTLDNRSIRVQSKLKHATATTVQRVYILIVVAYMFYSLVFIFS